MPTTKEPNFLFTQASGASIAGRIRRLRKARGWTLAEAEKRSHGQLKAVVIGSYERGDRSMSIDRAIEIANLFSIPLSELLAEPASRTQTDSDQEVLPRKIVIDLRRAKSAQYEVGEASETFSLFLAWIIGLRQDWNGEVLSLRLSDLETLSLMMFKSPESLINWLNKYQLLIPNFPTPAYEDLAKR
jgi:transcriptional regulator with XRE-family HTH domain